MSDHVGYPSDRASARELFRNTVAVADVDPPNVEFRIMRQLARQDEPDVVYTTTSKSLALRELREITQYHTQMYVWLEQRAVGQWKESE